MKNIRTFDGFVNESKKEEVVVDKKVKDILDEIFNKFKAKYTDLDSCKELVDEFIKGTTFEDLKDKKGVSEITLPRLLKKFDSKIKAGTFSFKDNQKRIDFHDLHGDGGRFEDAVLDDITSHFKKLNGGNTNVVIKKK